jgi:hypothetical protein
VKHNMRVQEGGKSEVFSVINDQVTILCVKDDLWTPRKVDPWLL